MKINGGEEGKDQSPQETHEEVIQRDERWKEITGRKKGREGLIDTETFDEELAREAMY